MSYLFNFLAQLIIILVLVFVVLAIVLIIWYYFRILEDMVRDRFNKHKDIKYDKRSIIEQLDEAFGGNNDNKRRDKCNKR